MKDRSLHFIWNFLILVSKGKFCANVSPKKKPKLKEGKKNAGQVVLQNKEPMLAVSVLHCSCKQR